MSTAERVKASGNEYFKKGKIDAAIGRTRSASLDPTNAITAQPRLCHRSRATRC